MHATPTHRPPHAGILALPLLLCIVAAARLVYLARPDLVANYPFHFPDSFDWIVNGLYYIQRLVLGETPAEITIRQPLFPVLIGAGYLTGHTEWLVALLPLTSFLSICAFFRLAQLFQMSRGFATLGVILLSLHYPFNFYSFYFMADPFGVAMMSWSAVLYADALINRHKLVSRSTVGAVLASLASLVQLYGLFPALVFAAFLLLRAARERSATLFGLLVANLFVAVSGQLAWMGAKNLLFGSYFATRVMQFGFLKLTWENLPFYMEVWPIYFAPLLIALLFVIPSVRPTKVPAATMMPLFYLLSVIAAFVVFVFAYQVQDSRFTTYFLMLAYFVALFVADSLAHGVVPRSMLIAACVVGGYAASAPTDNLDRPTRSLYFETLGAPNAVLRTNIITRLFETEPVERLADNECLRFDPITRKTAVSESCRTVPVQMYVNDSLKDLSRFQKQLAAAG